MSCHVCAEGAQRCVCETPVLDMWVDGMLSLVTHSSSHQVLAVLHEHGVPVDGTECETLLGQTPLEVYMMWHIRIWSLNHYE